MRAHHEDPCGITFRCSAPECGRTTAGGKPFCIEHVSQNPYMSVLSARLRARDVQFARVQEEGRGAADCESHGADEIRRELLENGPMHQRRLCSELQMPSDVARFYLAALKARGEVTVSRGVVRLTGSG